MKKYSLLLFVLFLVGFSACKKTTTTPFDAAAQAVTDDATIQAYLKANNITATKDPSGLYYTIIKAGTGAFPTASSNVTVSYSAIFTDGTVFDHQPSAYFSLATGVIKGWQIGVPHINAGGTIELFIPSALGYANVATGAVPANTVTIFTIGLQGFNN
jgi:FKBP-type peptidyl-prolyl cis-trans isomerase FkpA